MRKVVVFLLFFLSVFVFADDGINLRTYKLGNVRIDIFKIDAKKRKVFPVVGNGIRIDRFSDVNYIGKVYDAKLVVNGTYFGKNAQTLGVIISNKVLKVMPAREKVFGRTAVGQIGNEFYIGPLDIFLSIETDNMEYPVKAVNYPVIDDGLYVFTKDFSKYDEEGISLGKKWRVFSYNDDLLNKIVSSKNINYKLDLNLQWKDAKWIMMAGPVLLPRVGWRSEKFYKNLVFKKRARTFVALKENSRYLYIGIVRRPGLDLPTLSKFLKENGFIWALNFDGGTSTQCYYNNKLFYPNKILRKVTSFLVVK